MVKIKAEEETEGEVEAEEEVVKEWMVKIEKVI